MEEQKTQGAWTEWKRMLEYFNKNKIKYLLPIISFPL